MGNRPTRQEAAAFAAAAHQVRERMGDKLMADRALRKAEQAGDPFRLLEAAYEVDSTIDDVLEAVLRAGTWGDTSPFGLTQAQAVGIRLERCRQYKAFYRKTVGWMLDLAYDRDPDLRQQARAQLLRRDLATEYELENFPRASVVAIVGQRYAEWDEATAIPEAVRSHGAQDTEDDRTSTFGDDA